MLRTVCVPILIYICGHLTHCQLDECHDDPTIDPEEGILRDTRFTWLGILQYIHIKTGDPHYFRAPRVVLISRQYVLSTAVDAVLVPDGYALGNIAFGEYSRDESECRVTSQMMTRGLQCESAALLMPVADVLLHPHLDGDGTRDGVALLKMVGAVLGNIAFGEYSRDESECRVTSQMMTRGLQCESAALLMPVADVLLHPHLDGDGARDGVALLKMIAPVRSRYMLPVCLPLKNYIFNSRGRIRKSGFYHLDFVSDVPRDVIEEDREITIIKLLPIEVCDLYGNINTTLLSKSTMVCTTGCGMHSGAPSLIHEHTGQWSVVALAHGSATCPDPLRPRRPPPPPHHTLIYPYVPWIVKSIYGSSNLRTESKNNPFGLFPGDVVPRSSSQARKWLGRWWVGGVRCFDRGKSAEDLFRFYHEIFQITVDQFTSVSYFLSLRSAYKVVICCVKVGMQYHQEGIKLWGLESREVKLYIPITLKYSGYFKFQLEAWGYNGTATSATSVTNSSAVEPSKPDTDEVSGGDDTNTEL